VQHPDINISVDTDNDIVVIQKGENVDSDTWRFLVLNYWREDLVYSDIESIKVSYNAFLNKKNWIRDTCKKNGLQVSLSKKLFKILSDNKEKENFFNQIANNQKEINKIDPTEFNLTRSLTKFQIDNVNQLIAMKSGANFSVPGSGKTCTTLTIFNYLYNHQKVNKLLVICPKSAFGSWEEENDIIFKKPYNLSFFDNSYPLINVDIVILNYEKLQNENTHQDLLRWCRLNNLMIVLDEAHKVKGGSNSVRWQKIKELTDVAKRVDLLTGTPMPQGYDDLRNLFSLSWSPLNNNFFTDSRLNSLRRGGVFVRTTKEELGLPPVKLNKVSIEQGRIQRDIYSALRDRYVGLFRATNNDLATLRQKGKAIMTLIAASTNPGMISGITNERSFMGSNDSYIGLEWPPTEVVQADSLMDKIINYRDRERPNKYIALEKMLLNLQENNEKVIIWSNFINSLRVLHEKELKNFSTALVYGAIGMEDRKKEIDKFRNDPDCIALITNPQTLGEGISLHKECHNAIYIDRTYNAGMYLQSVDRIHRLGLSSNQITNIYFFESTGTIDNSVSTRLANKIQTMGQMLDDPNLAQSTIPDIDDEMDFNDIVGLDNDLDIQSATNHILNL
jgi:superfamily II DNA or RNA helicase